MDLEPDIDEPDKDEEEDDDDSDVVEVEVEEEEEVAAFLNSKYRLAIFAYQPALKMYDKTYHGNTQST
jgi:hypothetical protein